MNRISTITAQRRLLQLTIAIGSTAMLFTRRKRSNENKHDQLPSAVNAAPSAVQLRQTRSQPPTAQRICVNRIELGEASYRRSRKYYPQTLGVDRVKQDRDTFSAREIAFEDRLESPEGTFNDA